MVDKTDDMLISMSVDLAVIRRAMKKLEGDIAATSGNVVKKFEAMGKGIDHSMVTAMQARIDKMTGIGTKAAKEWNGALSQQGAELDKLRQKYNPVFAAVNNYKAAVVDIQRAHNLGALSADEMAAAIQRERKATLDSIAAIKGRNAALSQKPAKDHVNQFNTANLAAQFQDIAVTTAMGMSPLQIALQQGTQISAVLGPMGAAGAVKSLGAAFVSIISPVSLATIGLVAGTAAAIQFFTSTREGAKTVDEILKQHETNIKRLGPAYEEALRQQKKYVSESPELVASNIKDDFKAAIDKRIADAKAAIEGIKSAMLLEKMAGVTMGGVADELPSRFAAAQKAIADFDASIKAGKPNVDAFQIAIVRLENAGSITSAVASELKKFTIEAKATEIALSGVTGTIDPFAKAMADVSKIINEISSAKAKNEISALADQAGSGEKKLSELLRSINGLSGKYPDMSNTIDELSKVVLEALKAKAAINQLTMAQGSDLSKSFPAGEKGGRLGSPSLDEMKERNQALFDEQLNFMKRWDNSFRDKLDPSNKKLNKTPKTKVDRDANAYRDLVKSAQDRIDQMQLEEQLISKTGVAADTLRMRLELLQRAQDKGRELSPRQQKELEALAHAYGEAAQKVAALSAAEELRFEREQMFRSPAEQRVAGQLRNMGLDANSDFGQLIAGQIRLNEKLAEGRDMAKDFVSGFTQDLLNGVSAMDALANAASRLGSKLLDMAMDQAINGLFGNLMGVFSGGLGGGSPFANSGQLAGAFASGIGGMWAEGGYTGSGGKYDPAGIVHKGEYVIPKWLVDKIGVGNIERLFAGYSSGGLVGASVPTVPALRAPRVPDLRMPYQSDRATESAKVDINVNVSGARGNSEIQQMVADGVSQGLQQYDREMLPQRFRQIARDPYAVG